MPLIARWTGLVQPGAQCAHVASFADMLPTLAEIAGTKAPAEADGISIVPSLLGATRARRAQPSHEFLYWEHDDGTKRAVRMQRFKGIRTGSDVPLELYDLMADESEQRNVAVDHPDVVSQMEQIMSSAHRAAPPQTEPEPPAGAQYR